MPLHVLYMWSQKGFLLSTVDLESLTVRVPCVCVCVCVCVLVTVDEDTVDPLKGMSGEGRRANGGSVFRRGATLKSS